MHNGVMQTASMPKPAVDQAMAARLREARTKDGRYQYASDAARAMGRPIPTYSGHEGGSRGFMAEAAHYADFYKINLSWLLSGKGQMKRGGDDAAARPAPAAKGEEEERREIELPRFDLMPRNVPVYGSAACATGEEGEFEFNTGDIVDFVKRPPRLEGVKDAYALYLTGTSMVPWRKDGGLAYIHPGLPPQIEGHVVVQLKPAREGDAPHAMVKQLLKVTAKDILLHQYNPARDRSFARSKVVTLHRVMEWEELFGGV